MDIVWFLNDMPTRFFLNCFKYVVIW